MFDKRFCCSNIWSTRQLNDSIHRLSQQNRKRAHSLSTNEHNSFVMIEKEFPSPFKSVDLTIPSVVSYNSNSCTGTYMRESVSGFHLSGILYNY